MGERAANKIQINTVSKKICAFSEDENTLVVVTQDGRYFNYNVKDGSVIGSDKGQAILNQ